MTAESERDEGDGGHGEVTLDPASRAELERQARQILGEAWRSDGEGGGFCVPHAGTYPWQWLWDSCFHAVVWAHLGDERAALEVAAALADQDADGFVPHMRYAGAPNPHADFWRRRHTSSITQPPMFGHAVSVVLAAGLPVPERVVARAGDGLRFLLDRRRRSAGGLVELCHPWESGCDDSPRWDGVLEAAWTSPSWHDTKGRLLETIERSSTGAALANPAFPVGSAGFSSLVAWNAIELAGVTGDERLLASARELVQAVDARWDADLCTWIDDGPTAPTSGRVRTLDALLPLLVVRRPEAMAQLTDPTAFGARFGPSGVHRAEPSFDPASYWRGAAWPQLSYLSWRAARWAGDGVTELSLQNALTSAAVVSGFSEYWEPDSGASLGAAPQSWSTLACVVAS